MRLDTLRTLALWITPLAFALGATAPAAGAGPKKPAPPFTLNDTRGQTFDLNKAKDRPLLILYFFDVDSRPSQEGLLALGQTAKQFKDTDLAVWAITLSPKDRVAAFAKSAGLTFPLLLDSGAVSDQYQARVVLPTVCLVGPGLTLLDRFQGGGKTTEAMLLRVAERKLQQRSPQVAGALGAEVAKRDPKNAKARAVQGYAALKEKKPKQAQEVFAALAKGGGEGEVLGKEGLAAVHASRGEADQALALASEVEQKAPERAYARVIKADVLYARNQKKEAEEEYRKATEAKDAEPYQDALRFNQLGRLYANRGEYQKARALYDEAVQVDPYYVEGTTNKGVSYEKQGQWDKALESYRQALAVDGGDAFAGVLARKAQEMVDLQRDADRSKRMDQLVRDLAARYRSQKEAPPRTEDAWTSGPMILTFLDVQEKGGLAERDGFSAVFLAQLTDRLNTSGRVKVVERALMERLLEELNLGSSELASPETALRLGRILAARLIGTGTVLHGAQGSLLSLRLIDTETSAIPQVSTQTVDSAGALDKNLFALNREILRTVVTQYPLRGFVARIDGPQALLNLGSAQGVVQGTRFAVLEEGESVPYKGKMLKGAPKEVGQLEVTRVEPELSYAKVVRGDRPLRVDDKVQERAEEGAAP
ncbi:MAG: redoxin domain-containing protein [Deltaproteobacteria bacterium]|nr:redoxin domain-containing protein [Deltaproteobacteria bacterium]